MNTLIIQLMLLQVAVPLLLIGMHTLIRVSSKAGWWARTIGVALVLLYVSRTGVWLFPPWWTPWALGAFHVLASLVALNRYRRCSAIKSRRERFAEVLVGLLLSAGVSILLLPTFEGRRLPANVIDLAMPFESGRFLATSGGSTIAVNSHLKTLQADRYAAYRGQSYAVDLIGVNQWGFRTDGISPIDPTRYFIYGRTVTAPCSGSVAIAVDGVADMLVPQMDRNNMLGNHVVIHCQGVFVVLAHLAPESVIVSSGDLVKTGDPIGAVGNSGNTADPHLHIHVQASLPGDDPISAEPLWFTLDERFLVINDVILVQ